MKNILLKTVLAASTLVVVSTTFAASTGVISFNGQLVDSTCKVDVNGQGGSTLVNLPSVSINELTEKGAVAGRTTFNLNLSDCPLTSNEFSKVAAFFQPGASVDLETGRLLNSGTAEEVKLQLLDVGNNYSVINVGNTNQTNNAAYADISAAGTASLPYAVEYYAEGQTVAGSVVSSVVYNIQYK